ncbi:NnrU family protein [Maritimibacter dapengensis]|uniref:NnrU family protein n=1 Tax=Maritimibacter dapengensis TaxID=2836868 RepID=A0ABS6T6M1_9RHOB|nr:NnrU family protein [Maritimibacter dapengensis]MBV7380595.1 NnrU family protein [Maritimibacter dapengensis]
MEGWAEYTLAMIAFLSSHFVPRVADLRGRLMSRIGRRAYFIVYGIVSLLLFGWVISAAGRAPFIELWPQTSLARWAPNLVMPIALILVSVGIGMRQPFTLGSRRNADFDPDDPGIAAISRHPLFLALAIWAISHLLPNGDLAHVILFGAFAMLAVLAIPAFDARARRVLMGGADRFFTQTALLSVAPFTDRDWRARHFGRFMRRAGIGLVIWVGLLMAHAAVIGVAPFP